MKIEEEKRKKMQAAQAEIARRCQEEEALIQQKMNEVA